MNVASTSKATLYKLLMVLLRTVFRPLIHYNRITDRPKVGENEVVFGRLLLNWSYWAGANFCLKMEQIAAFVDSHYGPFVSFERYKIISGLLT